MAFDDISLARTKEIIYALKYLGRDISEKTSLEIIKEFKSTRMVDGINYMKNQYQKFMIL